MASLTDQGVAALRAGDAAAARALLTAAVRERPDDARAWLWLSGALSDRAQQRYCLERALALDPSSEAARRGLEELAQRVTPSSAEMPGVPSDCPVPAANQPRAALAGAGTAAVEPSRVARAGVPPSLLRAALSWLAAALAGVSALLGWAAAMQLGEKAGTPAILAVAVAGGAPLGLVALVLGGVLLRTSGRWLGGAAGAARVRDELGWAAAPAAWGLLLWGTQLWLLPAATFGGGPVTDVGRWAATALAGAHGLLWFWAAARSIRGLAAAHGFGPARAVGSWLLAALIVAAAAFVVLGCSAFVIGLRGG